MKPFGSERFRVVSILLKLLIGCVLLNLLLTSWIIVSLRLHKVWKKLLFVINLKLKI